MYIPRFNMVKKVSINKATQTSMTSFRHQIYILIQRNFRLQMKAWKSQVCIILIAPILCMSIMALIQNAASAASLASNPDPAARALGPVLPCVSGVKGCITIVYSPDTLLNKLIMKTFIKVNSRRGVTLNLESSPNINALTSNLGVVALADDNVMHDYIYRNQNTTAWGIRFYHKLEDNNLNYEIWHNITNFADSSSSYASSTVVPESSISLQRGIEESILTVQQHVSDLNNPPSDLPDDTTFASLDYNLKNLPSFPRDTDVKDLQYPVRSLLPLLIFISTVPQFINIVSTITNEESKGLISALVAAGVWPSAYYVSQLLTSVPASILNSLVTSIFGMIYGFEILALGNVTVIWIANILYQLSVVCLGMLIASMLRKPAIALFVCIALTVLLSSLQIVQGTFMVVGGSAFPIYYLWYDLSVVKSASVAQSMNMLPLFNFNKIMSDVFSLNARYKNATSGELITPAGYDWPDAVKSNFIKSYKASYPNGASLDDVPQSGDNFGIMVAIGVFYFVMALYMDKIVSNVNGKYESPFFFLNPNFLKSFLGSKDLTDLDLWINENKESTAVLSNDPGVRIKSDSALHDKSQYPLRVLNLTKKYGMFSKKLAVNSISFTFDEGQLLAFLGQNGGGKTTTLKILSGFLSSTSGDAIVYKKSVKTDSNAIQQFSGITPQFDLLYPELNALEHMSLFCDLKKVEGKTELIKTRLTAVLLWDVRKLPIKAYSGGMKRRLSMIISTIGDPTFLILDEPTTGMDPFNRRLVWQFLEKFKKGRVVVLTTHSMEEASALGDEISVMKKGNFIAFGSAVALKNQYGCPYRLNCNVSKENVPKAKELISQYIEYKVIDENAGSLIVEIEKTSDKMIELLGVLENSTDAGFIQSFGISQGTLEDVFIKLMRQ
eukprot:NODE_803_length_4108_cov_0.268396.p1 type:complete len:895 gc:universal NODE_803_length_4108_cov_0.268396:952-3636(+)